MPRKKKRTSKKIPLLVICIAAILLVAAGSMLFLSMGSRPVDPQSEDHVVLEIPQGSGTGQIANLLEEEGLIRSTLVFRVRSKLSGNEDAYKAGTYTFSPAMSMKEIMEIIMGGASEGETFQIIEGLTVKQIAKSLESQGIVSAASFLDEVQNGDFDYPFMKYLPEGESRLEGFLFPDTYEVPMNADAHTIIDTMLGQFNKVFPQEDYAKAEELGFDVYEVVIVASLIEREVREDQERHLVASVVYNRLDQGMKLEFCSTVQFILGDPKAVLTTADTQIQSPYNTYLHQGLPPGPICSPGEAAIRGALEPADTDYLYFVLKSQEATTHNFSSDYQQFLKDKAAYKASF